jgi:hypothetical protein
MHWLMLLSSRRWVSAFSGSASGRIGEFRDAQKGIASTATPDINRPTLVRKRYALLVGLVAELKPLAASLTTPEFVWMGI